MTGFVYLATPYSKYAPKLSRATALDVAYAMACRARADLMLAGVPCFSPIAHSHGVATHGGLDPLDHAIWLPSEKPIRDASRALCVYQAEGWDQSYGIRQEVDEFIFSGRPVFNWAPGNAAAFAVIVERMKAICGVVGGKHDAAPG